MTFKELFIEKVFDVESFSVELHAKFRVLGAISTNARIWPARYYLTGSRATDKFDKRASGPRGLLGQER